MIRTEDYKREFIAIFFAQKRLIFWTTYLIFVGAMLVAFYWPSTYAATGTILISGKQVEDRTPQAVDRGETRAFEVMKEDISSEVEILVSPEVIRSTLQSLGRGGQGAPTAADAAAVHAVARNLRTKVVPATNVIEVQYLDPRQDRAVQVLDTLMDNYLALHEKLYAQRAQPPAQLFADQAARLGDDIRKKEDRLVELVQSTGAAEPANEILENIKLKKVLEQQRNELRSQLIEATNNLDQIDKALARDEFQYFSFVKNDIINQLSLKLETLAVERGVLLRTFMPAASPVTAMDEQIRDTMRALRTEVVAYRGDFARKLRILESQLAGLEREIAGYDRQNTLLQAQLIETGRILREAEVMKASFTIYSARKDEVEITNLLGPKNPTIFAKVVNRAFPSNGPVFPKRNLVIPLGLAIGLITGFSLGFVREYFDHTFKKPSDVTVYAGLPVLFSLAQPGRDALDRVSAWLVPLCTLGALAFLAFNYLTR
jgi:uncharacterized protein involved in exopolysaccharide biosynthesis